jgi:hypothetical protein
VDKVCVGTKFVWGQSLCGDGRLARPAAQVYRAAAALIGRDLIPELQNRRVPHPKIASFAILGWGLRFPAPEQRTSVGENVIFPLAQSCLFPPPVEGVRVSNGAQIYSR